MNTILSFVIGLFLRLGIPVAVSALIFTLLRRLDERWQREVLAVPVISSQRPCWEIKGCSTEKRKDCQAATKPNIPCWQVFRTKKGFLKDECLGCEVFHLSPAPVKA